MKFDMLKYDTQKVIVFDVNKSLDIKGDTGPYILYTIARINSLLDKNGFNREEGVVYGLLSDPTEKQILRILFMYNDALKSALDELKPSYIAHYLLELAQALNTFYHACDIKGAQDNVRKARMALLSKAKVVMIDALDVLNIDHVEEM
jgi:arginyl-tRNA synthetase